MSQGSNGKSIRAGIDALSVTTLTLLSGGASITILAFLPNVLGDSELNALVRPLAIALALFGLALTFSFIHNHFRRKCSVAYDQGQIPCRPFGLPFNEPCVCLISRVLMWLSISFFLLGGFVVVYSIYQMPANPQQIVNGHGVCGEVINGCLVNCCSADLSSPELFSGGSWPWALRYLFEGLSATLPVVIGALLAYRLYLKRRENEILTARYLSDGIDKIAASLQDYIQNTNHNFALAVNMLQAVRDVGEEAKIDQFDQRFVRPRYGRLGELEFFRLYGLTHADEFFSLFQDAVVGYEAAMRLFSERIIASLEAERVASMPEEERTRACNALMNQAKAEFDAVQKWRTLLGVLQDLRVTLEVRGVDKATVGSFYKTKPAKEFRQALKKHFSEEIEKAEEIERQQKPS